MPAPNVPNYLVRGFLCLLLTVMFSCEQPNPEPSPLPPTPLSGDEFPCEAAVVFLFDISGSMDNPIDGGETRLERLVKAAVDVVEMIPSGQWNMGLYTFANTNNGLQWWGMDVLTDDNRQSFIDTLESLVPAGGSYIHAGLLASALMLNSDQDRRRFLVIFTDGEICSPPGPYSEGTCDDVVNLANQMKNDYDITIKTLSYGIPEGDPSYETQLQTLRDMASPAPDSSGPAFINTATADDLYNSLTGNLGEICDFFEVTIDVDRTNFELGSDHGESGGVGYKVSYDHGPARDVQILTQGSFINALGSVRFEGPHIGELSSTSPFLGGKLILLCAENMIPGSHALTLRVVPVGGDLTLASKSLQVNVVPFTLNISFDQNPVWNSLDKTIQGKLRVETNSLEDVGLDFNYLVYDSSGESISGFTPDASTAQWTTMPTGDQVISFSFKIKWNGPPDNPSPGQYSVRLWSIMDSLGVIEELYHDVTIP